MLLGYVALIYTLVMIGMIIYSFTKPSHKSRLIRDVMIWAWPVMVIIYSCSCILPSLPKTLYSHALPILLIAFFILYLPIVVIYGTRAARENKDLRSMRIANQIQDKKSKDAEEQMGKWKEEHKRTRCPYCGTYNMVSALHCVSCGAAVEYKNKE